MLLGDHAVVYENPCLVTAVGQRMHATVTVLDEPIFELQAPDVGIKDYQKPMVTLGEGDVPKGARFVEAAIQIMLQATGVVPKGGIRVETRSEFSSQFGFGSSSSSTVCVVKALSELFGLHLSNKELFDVAYQSVLSVQGVGSGFDIAAGIYGGTLYFVGGGAVIEPIVVDTLPLIVGYSGIKGDTPTLVKMVAARREENPALFHLLFEKSNALVESGKDALLNQDWKYLGELFGEGETLMQQYEVEIEKLSHMIQEAEKAGAWGAKMSGAGGGDCMIAVADGSAVSSVEKVIATAGGEIVAVETNVDGVRIEA